MKSMHQINGFIVGTSYTGSTLLGAALNVHSDIAYVGELARIPAYQEKYGHYEYTGSCMQCFIDGDDCALFADAELARLGQRTPAQSLDAIRKKTTKSIVIDGSKYVDWLRIVQADSSVEPRVIILAKSPVEYLKSCQSRGIEPLWAEANAWRDTYVDVLRTTSRLGIPSLVVRYMDYVDRPEQVLRRICGFMGVRFEKRMLEPQSRPLHAIGGNPGAYLNKASKKLILQKAKEVGQKEFDINPLRLQTKLFSKLRHKDFRQIAFETPGLVDIASQLGYLYKDF